MNNESTLLKADINLHIEMYSERDFFSAGAPLTKMMMVATFKNSVNMLVVIDWKLSPTDTAHKSATPSPFMQGCK